MRKKGILKEDESQETGNQFRWFGLVIEVPTEMGFDRWGDPEVEDVEYQLFPVWARNEEEAEEEQREYGWPYYSSDEYDFDDDELTDGFLVGAIPLSDNDVETLGISVDDLNQGGNEPEAYSDECATYTEPSPGKNDIEDILVGMGLGSDDYMRDEYNDERNWKNIYGGYHLVRNNRNQVNLMDPESGEVILSQWMKAIRPIKSENFEWSFSDRSKKDGIQGRYIAEGTMDGKTYFLIDSDGGVRDLGDYKIQGQIDGSVVIKSPNGYNVIGPDGNLKFKKDAPELSPSWMDKDSFIFQKDANSPKGIYDREGNGLVGAERGYRDFNDSGIYGTFLAQTDNGYEILDNKTGENVFGTYFDEEPKTVSTFSKSHSTGYRWVYDSDGNAEKDYEYEGGNDTVVLHSPEKGYGLSPTRRPLLIGGRWSEEPIKSVNLAKDKTSTLIVLIFTINGKEYAFYNNKFFPKERIQNYIDNRDEFDTAENNRSNFNNLERIRKQYPGEDFNAQEKYWDEDAADDARRRGQGDPYHWLEPQYRQKKFADKAWKPGEYGWEEVNRPYYDVSDKAYNAAQDKMNASKVGNKPWYDTEVPGETKFQEGRNRGGSKISITEADINRMVFAAVNMILESRGKRRR